MAGIDRVTVQSGYGLGRWPNACLSGLAVVAVLKDERIYLCPGEELPVVLTACRTARASTSPGIRVGAHPSYFDFGSQSFRYAPALTCRHS